MPYLVIWDNNAQTAIRTEWQGNWTWDEYHQALDEVARLMKSVSHPVDVINTSAPNAVMPKGNPIPHFRRAAKQLPNNNRFTINTGRTGFAQTMMKIFRRMFPKLKVTFFFASSLEEARQIIAEFQTDEYEEADSR